MFHCINEIPTKFVSLSWYSPKPTQVRVVLVVKVASPTQLTVPWLSILRNPSSHATVSSVLVSTGNVVCVLSLFQAGFRPVQCMSVD